MVLVDLGGGSAEIVLVPTRVLGHGATRWMIVMATGATVDEQFL